MNKKTKLLLGYMQQYIDEPNAPDYSGEYPVCWEITTDECECIINYIKSLQQKNKQLKEDLKVYDKIFDTFSKRKYAHKYLEERRKEIPNLLAPDSDEIYEKYYQLKEENENLRETIKNDDLTINKLCKENKILRENAEHNDKVVDDYWWENKHYKHIIDELEKWLKDIKEGIEELTIDFQEWGHPAKPSIVIDDVLNKLQELKGSDYEKRKFN